MQNPTGAIAKANQNAATQPPTVIIQATASGLPFSYKDDCYYFRNYVANINQYVYFVGLGKVDAGLFTGIAGVPGTMSGSYLIAASIAGANTAGTSNIFFNYGANSGSAMYSAYADSRVVVMVYSLAVDNAQKCYP